VDSPRARRWRGFALPLGLVLAASLGGTGAAAVGGHAPLTGAHRQAPAAAKGGKPLSYVVNTKANPRVIRRVEKEIARAGGTVVTAYGRIGVIVAHSANPRFGDLLRAAPDVDTAGVTRTAPLKAASTTDVGRPAFVRAPETRSSTGSRSRAKAAREEPLEPLQWDKRAIGADKASRIDEGSRRVTVGVIDTGVDDTHPDLKANFSPAQSASCVGGKADTSPGAWRPSDPAADYHGTHVAGIIAAPRNGVGVAGVAPGVKVASVKVAEPKTSLFYTEAVVCAMVFAADHGVEVTNNSYYTDPWLYNCEDDKDQKALVDAVGRATRYATRAGVTTVASAGNSSQDLAADKLQDSTSPDDGTPAGRTVDPARCPDLPSMLSGVTSVSATGPEEGKSYYSNYGLDQIDVAAPGGDRDYQTPSAPAKDGGVLSTMPDGDYAYLQGTSMAGPQVAGVAALLKSTHPRSTPQELGWLLKTQARAVGCPRSYDPDGKGTYEADCVGTKGHNGFYGHGIVDALAAVRR
jgi:hypothetical protein